MLALTYINKAQYRQLRNEANKEDYDIRYMFKTYGVCTSQKVAQFMIIQSLETCWDFYKKEHKGRAPKSSDEFYNYMVAPRMNTKKGKAVSPWLICIELMNEDIDQYNETVGKSILDNVQDNAYTRAILYTHIKAKIGDWEDF